MLEIKVSLTMIVLCNVMKQAKGVSATEVLGV